MLFSRCHPPAKRLRRARGFTLVEVLVAMAILAILAVMAWQGVDALARSRDAGERSTHASVRLATAMAQWQADLNALQASGVTPTLRFDAGNLRLTRRMPDGLQIVVWTRQDGALWRWASRPTSRVEQLQESWLQSQAWSAMQPEALKLLDDVSDWQVYYFRRGDSSWSNPGTTGNVQQNAPPVLPADRPPSSPEDPPGGPPGVPPEVPPDTPPENEVDALIDEMEELPIGVRVVIQQTPGTLTRDVVVGSTQ